MQTTLWPNVVFLLCPCLFSSLRPCQCHSLLEKPSLVCSGSQVCAYYYVSCHILLDFFFFDAFAFPELLQCSYSTMLATGYPHFSWSLCMLLNLWSLCLLSIVEVYGCFKWNSSSFVCKQCSDFDLFMLTADNDWNPFFPIWVLWWPATSIFGLNPCVAVWAVYIDQVIL